MPEQDYSYENDEFWGEYRKWLTDNYKWSADQVDQYLAQSPEKVRASEKVLGLFEGFNPYKKFVDEVWSKRSQGAEAGAPGSPPPDLTDSLVRDARSRRLRMMLGGRGRRSSFVSEPMLSEPPILGG